MRAGKGGATHFLLQALIAVRAAGSTQSRWLLTHPQNKTLLLQLLGRRLRQHAQRQPRQNGSHYLHVWQLLPLTVNGIVALDENLKIVVVLSLERLVFGGAPARSLLRTSLFPPGRNVCRLRDGSRGVGDEDCSSPLNPLPPQILSSLLAGSLSVHHS